MIKTFENMENVENPPFFPFSYSSSHKTFKNNRLQLCSVAYFLFGFKVYLIIHRFKL